MNTKLYIVLQIAFLCLMTYNVVAITGEIIVGTQSDIDYVWLVLNLGIGFWIGHSLIYKEIPQYKVERSTISERT